MTQLLVDPAQSFHWLWMMDRCPQGSDLFFSFSSSFLIFLEAVYIVAKRTTDRLYCCCPLQHWSVKVFEVVEVVVSVGFQLVHVLTFSLIWIWMNQLLFSWDLLWWTKAFGPCCCWSVPVEEKIVSVIG